MKRFLSAAVLAVLFFFQAVSVLAEDQPGPSLWKLGDEDTTIYIFGTIHVMNGGVKWQTSKIMTAFDSADTVVFEVAPEQLGQDVMGPLVQKYGILPPGVTLADKISPELYDKVGALVSASGAPANTLDRFQPWMVGTILVMSKAAENGFLPQFGVDLTLTTKALLKGTPTRGLETAEDQLSIFATIDDADQEEMLEQSITEIDTFTDLFISMRDAWMSRDLGTLDALVNEDMEDYPELAEAMLYNRNRLWAEEIEDMLDQPGTFFISVGTGHLVGKNNLILLLQDKGLEVERN